MGVLSSEYGIPSSTLAINFGDVRPFLQSRPPATTARLGELLNNSQKVAYLRLELAAAVDCGEMFVKATYNLEGDGPLVFKCCEVINTLKASIRCDHFPRHTAIAEKLVPASRVHQYIHYDCVSSFY